jgi:hypothetical protein
MRTMMRETQPLFPASGIIDKGDAGTLLQFLGEANATPKAAPFAAQIIFEVERGFADSQTADRNDPNFWQRVESNLNQAQLSHFCTTLAEALRNGHSTTIMSPHGTGRKDRWIRAEIVVLS